MGRRHKINSLTFFFVVICLASQVLRSQVPTIDSLKLALKNAAHDTTRCNILNAMIEAEEDEKIWVVYNEQLKQLAQKNAVAAPAGDLKTFYLKCLAAAFNNDGFIYQNQGNIEKSIEYFSRSLKIQEEIGDKKGIANSLNNIGFICKNQGDIAKAIEYYSKSLKMNEEIGDKVGIANSLINIGFIYKNQGDIAKAIEYYDKSLKIQEEIGDKNGLAISLNNIGAIYKSQGNIAKALDYYNKSLKMREEIGDKPGIANSLANLGTIYFDRGDIGGALDYYSKSLKIQEEIGNKTGIANSLNNVGGIYLTQKNYNKALVYCTKSLNLGIEIGYPEIIRNSSQQLKIIYQKLNQPKKALEMYELCIQMRDSINNMQTKKAAVKSQLKYEYEKKSAADSVKNAEQQKVKDARLAAQTASLKQEKFQRYSLAVGLLVVLVGLGFVVNRFRITQKQKKIIEEQKVKVDEAFDKLHEKNKEVMDSIYYARRIQRALITNEKYIERKLNELRK